MMTMNLHPKKTMNQLSPIVAKLKINKQHRKAVLAKRRRKEAAAKKMKNRALKKMVTKKIMQKIITKEKQILNLQIMENQLMKELSSFKLKAKLRHLKLQF